MIDFLSCNNKPPLLWNYSLGVITRPVLKSAISFFFFFGPCAHLPSTSSTLFSVYIFYLFMFVCLCCAMLFSIFVFLQLLLYATVLLTYCTFHFFSLLSWRHPQNDVVTSVTHQWPENGISRISLCCHTLVQQCSA